MGLSATSTARHEVSSPSRKTSSARSSDSPKPTHAVLSIKPEYAEAIFSGKKRFEFRRSIFRADIQVVIVYITSPVGQVAGEFSVKDIITDDVDALWDRTEKMAGIDRKVFTDYFAGRDVGHAIVIGNVKRYDQPLDLQKTYGVRPPQSFLYL
jgi:predicted transcriptional regulator